MKNTKPNQYQQFFDRLKLRPSLRLLGQSLKEFRKWEQEIAQGNQHSLPGERCFREQWNFKLSTGEFSKPFRRTLKNVELVQDCFPETPDKDTTKV